VFSSRARLLLDAQLYPATLVVQITSLSSPEMDPLRSPVSITEGQGWIDVTATISPRSPYPGPFTIELLSRGRTLVDCMVVDGSISPDETWSYQWRLLRRPKSSLPAA